MRHITLSLLACLVSLTANSQSFTVNEINQMIGQQYFVVVKKLEQKGFRSIAKVSEKSGTTYGFKNNKTAEFINLDDSKNRDMVSSFSVEFNEPLSYFLEARDFPKRFPKFKTTGKYSNEREAYEAVQYFDNIKKKVLLIFFKGAKSEKGLALKYEYCIQIPGSIMLYDK